MRFSVVVPAHNEERLIANGLEAIAVAADRFGGLVEVVVVANRCTDATEVMARSAGAVVVVDEARNISAVRNAGAAAATGEILVTIDADCVMDPRALCDIDDLLGTGRYVGGGTKVRPERVSPGIWSTIVLVDLIAFVTRLSAGMFWCARSDFMAVGGFDESLLVAEDLDFARRLRAHGRHTGRQYTMLRTAPVVSSCRKFDRYGDWHMFGMALQLPQVRASARGTDTSWVDRYFFDFNDAT